MRSYRYNICKFFIAAPTRKSLNNGSILIYISILLNQKTVIDFRKLFARFTYKSVNMSFTLFLKNYETTSELSNPLTIKKKHAQ